MIHGVTPIRFQIHIFFIVKLSYLEKVSLNSRRFRLRELLLSFIRGKRKNSLYLLIYEQYRSIDGFSTMCKGVIERSRKLVLGAEHEVYRLSLKPALMFFHHAEDLHTR
ncbi:hypothetical protein GCK32_012051 [Trichostrongylus colubriformis]|uniref:Uncharacterized protein n=1 Tax=Trichostrongylus colubriformis TaxID=6319 RepID=A0AAN8EW09_TRICO